MACLCVLLGVVCVFFGTSAFVAGNLVVGWGFTVLGLFLMGFLATGCGASLVGGRSRAMEPERIGNPDAESIPPDDETAVRALHWFPRGTQTVKVAGVRSRNADGSSRQAILKKCTLTMPVSLMLETSSRYAANSVQVVTPKGMVGYLPQEDADVIAPKYRSDASRWSACFQRVDSFEDEEGGVVWFAQLRLTEYTPREVLVRSTQKHLAKLGKHAAGTAGRSLQTGLAVGSKAVASGARWSLPRLGRACLAAIRTANAGLKSAAGGDAFVYQVFCSVVVIVGVVVIVVIVNLLGRG